MGRAALWAALGVCGFVGCGGGTHNSVSGASGADSVSGAAGSSSAGSSSAGSGGSSTGGGGNAAPIAIEDLCPVFTHDLCAYLMQCGGAHYRDAEHCEHELDCYGLPQLLAADKSGAVDYDPSQVGACHERFAASPCTFGDFLFTPDIYEVLSYCPGTITPKLKAGDACSSNGECSDGLYCYKGDDFSCPGMCRPFAKSGEDCAGSARCAEGLHCDNKLCAPDAKVGDACKTAGCQVLLSCPDGQVCDGNLWCDRDQDSCQKGRQDGEACGNIGKDPNTLAECALNLWCDAAPYEMGTCHKPSAEGGPCTFFFSCQEGLHCEGYMGGLKPTLGKCQPAGASGASCLGTPNCQKGLVCVNSLCAAPGGDGAACNGDDDCQPGFECATNQCKSVRYPGDACDGTRCTLSRCVDGTCQFHAKVGEACATADDCATSSCVNGTCNDDSVCQKTK